MPRPGEGQLLVRNEIMSVDPYMRGRMNDAKSYVPPFKIGEPLDGAAAGEVVESHSERFSPVDKVVHSLGWREYAVIDAEEAGPVRPDVAPLGAYLGVLGMPGLTAYVGLLDVARMLAGDAVFVSGAAGAVGSIVGQLAKLKGASRVIGSAGSAEKVRHLTEDLGFDAAFNYRDAPVDEQLASAAPDGIDVYFDNVGGDHLEAAIGCLKTGGRVAACGAVSQYNNVEPEPGPRNMFQIVGKRLTIQGFIVGDHQHRRQDFIDDVVPWVQGGSIHYTETRVDGLRNAPAAFIDLLWGKNTGKMLVNIT